MENQSGTQETDQQSPFCDMLMEVVGPLSRLADINDAAIVMCANEKTLSIRMRGSYQQHVNMLLNKMANDDKFAELIVESAMLYSQRMGIKPVADVVAIKKEDGHGKEEAMES